MKKILVTTLLLALMGISNIAMADIKIAVVDVRALVNKSAQVQALKSEQQVKLQELRTWLKTVKADVDKQQTREGKASLIKKYDAEFARKQQAIIDNYSKKLQAIDKSMTDAIVAEAKQKGYDIVLSKQGTVIYGGIDITESVMKVVK